MVYIETNSTDVFYNFALEYYFALEKPLEDTVFLFWRTTPSLMIGKYQNVLEEINKTYADDRNITIVRRMSGGGTIYTDLGGWQFSFIERKKANQITFKEYIEPVVRALNELGVKAEFNGRNDLAIEGKKFSGNAQYRLKDAVIHHGSLLYDTNIAEMVASTRVDAYKILSKSIKSVRDRVTNIADHIPNAFSPECFKQVMLTHILGENYKEYQLSAEDDLRIREIAADKFNNWQQIYGLTPAFNIEKTGRFEGGKIQFKIDVKQGIIREANVFGDFFASLDAEIIGQALVGARFEREDLLKHLYQNKIDGALYKISVEEMADTIIG